MNGLDELEKKYVDYLNSLSYKDYLKTDHWKLCRAKRLELDNDRCVNCGSPFDVEVHHLTYNNRGNENIEQDLITLCGSCHRKFHEAINGAKTDVEKLVRSFNKHLPEIYGKHFAQWWFDEFFDNNYANATHVASEFAKMVESKYYGRGQHFNKLITYNHSEVIKMARKWKLSHKKYKRPKEDGESHGT